MKYRAGYKYQLAEPYHYPTGILVDDDIVTEFLVLSKRGYLYISSGYAWDGATSFPDIDSIMRASLVHDSLYQLIRLEHLSIAQRKHADLIFWKICLEAGMFSLLANVVHSAVKRFGGPAADPSNKKPILVAP